MPKTPRVFHLTRNLWMNPEWALVAILDNCAWGWANADGTPSKLQSAFVRDLTEEEAVFARNERAHRVKLQEALAFAEIPGLRFQPPAYAQESTRREHALAAEANKFVVECLP